MKNLNEIYNWLKMKSNIYIIILISICFASCQNKELELKNQQIYQLKEQIETMKATNASLLDRMSDLSVVSKTGAESKQESAIQRFA